jgi:hypothetical protein
MALIQIYQHACANRLAESSVDATSQADDDWRKATFNEKETLKKMHDRFFSVVFMFSARQVIRIGVFHPQFASSSIPQLQILVMNWTS